MSETICPFCGHSPVPDRAERCPQCDREFSGANLDETGVTRTRLGGLTGSVTAIPTPSAVAMFLGAAWWLLRGTGWLGLEEPWWTLLVAVAHVAAAVAVLANLGPAQHFPSLVALMGAGVGLVISPGHPTLTAASAAYAVVVIAMTAGDPGPVRLWVGAALSAVAVLVGVGSVVEGQVQAPLPRLSNDAFSLTLPRGWHEAQAGALAPLKVPLATGQRSVWALETLEGTQQAAFGVLVAPTGLTQGQPSRCEELFILLGLPGLTGARAALVPPPVFGSEAIYLDVTLVDTLPARVACVERSAGALLLLVSSREQDSPGAAATAFESVVAGLKAR